MRTLYDMAIDVRRILVPLDFSDAVDPIMDWAIHLAEEHGSQLVLLHVYHLPVEFQQIEGAYLPADFWANVKQEADEQLRALAQRATANGVEVEQHVREGYPATIIVEEATELGADLVVIGTHGHTGLKHLLLGSIAERVVQKAPCPVLTVRAPVLA